MTLQAAELTVLAFAAALLAGALVYLFGSFFLMRAYVEQRPGPRRRAAMWRELYYVLITQPLIPVYFVRGRRLGAGTGTPVIFVHGYFQNRADFHWMARQFRKQARGPLYGFNYPWFDSVDRNVPRMDRFVEWVCAESGSDKVNLIAHSLGGLVCVEYAHTPKGQARVAHCITVGTPHAGVKWRGPLLGRVAKELKEGDFHTARRDRALIAPTLSVYSTHDNVVHPPTTSALASRGGRDVAVDGLGHLSLLYSPEVVAAVIAFLDSDPGPVITPADDAGEAIQ